MSAPTAWVSWSGGKDSAFALHRARSGGEVTVAGLITTVVEDTDEVTMSRLPAAVVRRQAEALGLELRTVALPWPCPNHEYEARTGRALADLRRRGAEQVVYGDLALADVRAYREATLGAVGLTAAFPLWGADTAALAGEMLGAGIRAVVVCADPRQVDPRILGRPWDGSLLADLPGDVDPCGENGEFHTVVTDGPGFERPVEVATGPAYERDGFHHLPVEVPTASGQ